MEKRDSMEKGMKLLSGRLLERPVPVVAQQEADDQENALKNEQGGEEADDQEIAPESEGAEADHQVEEKGTENQQNQPGNQENFQAGEPGRAELDVLENKQGGEEAGKGDNGKKKKGEGAEADPRGDAVKGPMAAGADKEEESHKREEVDNPETAKKADQEEDDHHHDLPQKSEEKRPNENPNEGDDRESKKPKMTTAEDKQGGGEAGKGAEDNTQEISDNELLRLLLEFLKSSNIVFLFPDDYPFLIEFLVEKLHWEIHPDRVIERLEALRDDFMAARGSPLFEISRHIWDEGGTSSVMIGDEGSAPQFTVPEPIGPENLSEKARGKRPVVSSLRFIPANQRSAGNRDDVQEERRRREACNQENYQKQQEDQEGDGLPADIDLLGALWEFIRVEENRTDILEEFIRRFAGDIFPEIDSTRVVTRILKLRENFLARARIWGVSPGIPTNRAVPISMSNDERSALRNRVQEAMDDAERIQFRLSESEWANLAAAVDSLYSSGSEDFTPLRIPGGLWTGISRILQNRSYSTVRNWTNAERSLIRGERLPFELKHPNEDYDREIKKPKMTCARSLSFGMSPESSPTPLSFRLPDTRVSHGNRFGELQNMPFEHATEPALRRSVEYNMPDVDQDLLDEISFAMGRGGSMGSQVPGTFSNNPIFPGIHPPGNLRFGEFQDVNLPEDVALEIALEESSELYMRGTSSNLIIRPENQRNTTTAASGDEVHGSGSKGGEEEEDPTYWSEYGEGFSSSSEDDELDFGLQKLIARASATWKSNNSPSTPANVPDSREGTSGSGADGSANFPDEQNKASGGDAEKEEKKPGDDDDGTKQG